LKLSDKAVAVVGALLHHHLKIALRVLVDQDLTPKFIIPADFHRKPLLSELLVLVEALEITLAQLEAQYHLELLFHAVVGRLGKEIQL